MVLTPLYSGNIGCDNLVVSILNIDFQGLSAPPAGVPIRLGTLMGYANDNTDAVGTRFYLISFDKRGWDYGVGANLGKNPGLPDNRGHGRGTQRRRAVYS